MARKKPLSRGDAAFQKMVSQRPLLPRCRHSRKDITVIDFPNSNGMPILQAWCEVPTCREYGRVYNAIFEGQAPGRRPLLRSTFATFQEE